MTLKEMLIASPECTFKMYRNASLFYVTQQGFVFEVPIAELGESSLGHTERSLSLMKWIRRAVESLKEEE